MQNTSFWKFREEYFSVLNVLIVKIKNTFTKQALMEQRRYRSCHLILMFISSISGNFRMVAATVKPLITNTSKEFIKCHIIHAF